MFQFRKSTQKLASRHPLKHKVAVRRNGHFAFSSFARTGTLCWLIFQVRLPPKRLMAVNRIHIAKSRMPGPRTALNPADVYNSSGKWKTE